MSHTSIAGLVRTHQAGPMREAPSCPDATEFETPGPVHSTNPFFVSETDVRRFPNQHSPAHHGVVSVLEYR